MAETYRFSDCGIVGMCEECDHGHLKRHNVNTLLRGSIEDGIKPLPGVADWRREPCNSCVLLGISVNDGSLLSKLWRQAVVVPWTYLTASERDGGAERG